MVYKICYNGTAFFLHAHLLSGHVTPVGLVVNEPIYKKYMAALLNWCKLNENNQPELFGLVVLFPVVSLTCYAFYLHSLFV